MRPVVLTVSPSPKVLVVTQHDGADRILFQVQRQSEGVAREFEHLAITRIGQAVYTHDAVRDRHDAATLPCLRDALEILDAAA